jgi:hypothetical protein
MLDNAKRDHTKRELKFRSVKQNLSVPIERE